MNFEYILGVVVLLAFVAFLVKKFKEDDSPQPPVATPTPPLQVEGVFVGPRTYGLLDNGQLSKCVDVISVNNGQVTYSFVYESEILTLGVQDFLDQFFYFPNGCRIPDDGPPGGRLDP